MKRVMMIGLFVLVAMFCVSFAWAGDCPPDKKAVESFCKANHPDKYDECVKGVMQSDCEKNITAVNEYKSEKRAGGAADEFMWCKKFGGGTFGCLFWMAVR